MLNYIKLRERQEKKARLFWYNLFNSGSVYFKNACDLDKNFELTPIGFEKYDDGTLMIKSGSYIKTSASASLIYMASLNIDSLSSKFEIPESVPREFVIKISFKSLTYPPYNNNQTRTDYYLENEYSRIETLLREANNYRNYHGYNNGNRSLEGYPGIIIYEDYPNISLLYEKRIYKEIINDLISKRYTPNLLLYVTSFTCNNFISSNIINKDIYMKNYLRQIQQKNLSDPDNRPKFDVNEANIMILEMGKGKSLRSYMSNDLFRFNNLNDTLKNLKEVLIQCLYSLEVFNQVGLQHQDSHFENIFVEKLDATKPLYYFYEENKCLNVNLQWMIKFFDWDRGFSTKLKNKGVLNLIGTESICLSYAQCNRTQKLLDLTKFLCYFYTEIKNNYLKNSYYEPILIEIRKFYQKILKNNSRLFELITEVAPNYYCLLCKDLESIIYDDINPISDYNKNKIIAIHPDIPYIHKYNYCNTKAIFDSIDKNSSMFTIVEMLNDSFFNDFRIDPTNLPYSEIFTSEEIYFLPSLETQIKNKETEIRASKTERLFQIKEKYPYDINVFRKIGFTDSDKDEKQLYIKQLIDILDKNLNPLDERKIIDNLNNYWKEEITRKHGKEEIEEKIQEENIAQKRLKTLREMDKERINLFDIWKKKYQKSTNNNPSNFV